MAMAKDTEKGDGNIKEPLIRHGKEVEQQNKANHGSLKMLLFSTAVAVCGSFAFGQCVGYSAPTQFKIMEELDLSYAEYSVFGSILTIGAMIGAITSGKIADFIGRRGAMRMSSIICLGGWIAIALASDPLLLDFGRFLTGCGIGNLSYVVPVYIAEITPKELRGALASANQLFIVVGLSIAYTIGAFVTWRTLALTGTVPCFIVIVGVFYIPESPRWLAMVGRHERFKASLRTLRGPYADTSQEEDDIQETLALLQQLPKATIADLFIRKNIRLVIVGVGMMFFQQFIGINGIVFYADHIFASAGVPPSIGSILYSSLQVLVTAIGTFVIDRAGRRPLLMISASGLLLGNIMIGTSFFLRGHHWSPEIVPALAITGVMVYIASFSIGMGAIPWVLMSELFPLNVKGVAGSLVTLVNWLGSWVISFSFNFLMGWSSYGTFYTYAGVCVLSIIFIVKLVPETKGRTLEEIQAAVN